MNTFSVKSAAKLYRNRANKIAAVLLGALLLMFGSSLDAREQGIFDFVLDGDMFGHFEKLGKEININGKANRAWPWMHHASGEGGEFLDFSLFFWRTFITKNGTEVQGKVCFPDGLHITSFYIEKTRVGTGEINVWFQGFDGLDLGESVSYLLILSGTFDNDQKFLPGIGETTTMSVFSWEMQTDGKGKLRNKTCTGEGGGSLVLMTVTTTRTS